jgi:hypothetical protein
MLSFWGKTRKCIIKSFSNRKDPYNKKIEVKWVKFKYIKGKISKKVREEHLGAYGSEKNTFLKRKRGEWFSDYI